MTVIELIRQCGNPEYLMEFVALPFPGFPQFEVFTDGTFRVIVGHLVRTRRQDGAELDRATVTLEELDRAMARGAVRRLDEKTRNCQTNP